MLLTVALLALVLLQGHAGAVAEQERLPAQADADSRGSWFFAGNLVRARGFNTASLLANGTKVLIAGGDGTSCEVFDVASRRSSTTASMATARSKDFTATVLSDDMTVLIAGGGSTSATTAAQVYDLRTGTFSKSSYMKDSRMGHAAVLLRDGRVIVINGEEPALGSGGFRDSSEVYNPSTNSWSDLVTVPFYGAYGSAVRLFTDDVLYCGGNYYYFPGLRFRADCAIYSIDYKRWNGAAPMLVENNRFAMIAIDEGRRVVVGGGFNKDSGYLSSVESFDVVNNKWSFFKNSLYAAENLAFASAPSVRTTAQYIYFLGGNIQDNVVASAGFSDITSTTNYVEAPMPLAVTRHSAVYIKSTKSIFVFGGSTTTTGGSTDLIQELELSY